MNKNKIKEYLVFMGLATTTVMIWLITYTAAEGHPIVRIIWGCN